MRLRPVAWQLHRAAQLRRTRQFERSRHAPAASIFRYGPAGLAASGYYGLGDELVSVYVPTTPNPTSGYFLLARRADVVDLAMSVDEALKYVISMGVVAPPARAQSAPAVPAISNPVSHSGK